MGKQPGGNGRELKRLDWQMGQSGSQNSTGLNGTVREGRKLKSRNTWSKKE